MRESKDARTSLKEILQRKFKQERKKHTNVMIVSERGVGMSYLSIQVEEQIAEKIAGKDES